MPLTRSLSLCAAVAACLLAAPLSSGCGKPKTVPPSAQSPLVGQPLPSFSRRTLAGQKIESDATRGQLVVVKFFAEYCAPCKRTLPAAQKLHAKNPDVVFIGISEDEYASQAQGMVDGFGLSFPVVHDKGNVLAGRFRVSEMPVTFVVDAQGVVRWVGGPGQDEDDLEAAVAALK